MRTSNKILGGTLLAILLFLTAVHAALYAKYRQHDFVTMKFLHNERYDSYELKGIQSVSITGFQNVTVIPADTARMEIEKSRDIKLPYEFSNGILRIKGDTMITRNDNHPERVRSYRDIILYLPRNQAIVADACNVMIRGAKDTSGAPMLSLDLKDTELHLGDAGGDNRSGNYAFSKISVTRCNGGSIELNGGTIIKELNLNLTSSNFEDGQASIGNLSVVADSSSVIKLSGKNITKAKFTLK